MALWVKTWLGKCKNLSSDFQYPPPTLTTHMHGSKYRVGGRGRDGGRGREKEREQQDSNNKNKKTI